MDESYNINSLAEYPAYSLPEIASYARVPYSTLRYWAKNGQGKLVTAPNRATALSFVNLLECHILNVLRTKYDLHVRAIRRALDTLGRLFPHAKHPLIEMALRTDRVDLFDETGLTNLSRGGRGALSFLQNYMERIEFKPFPKFYPFVVSDQPGEPRLISITPMIAFGRSVIDGTGIATAVVAARFKARESITDLAEEYGRAPREIEEAVRWEAIRTPAAA